MRRRIPTDRERLTATTPLTGRVSPLPFLGMGLGMGGFVLGAGLGAAGVLPLGVALGLGAAAVLGMPAVWTVRRRRQRDPGWISGAAFCFAVAGGVALLGARPEASLTASSTGWVTALGTGCVSAVGAGLYLAGHRAWHLSGWRLPG